MKTTGPAENIAKTAHAECMLTFSSNTVYQ